MAWPARGSSAIAVALVLVGCIHSPTLFTTPCGLRIHGLPDGGLPAEWTPASLAEAESRTLMMLDKYSSDPKTANACGKLKGWDVYPATEPKFVDPWGRTVAGFTTCAHDVFERNLSAVGAGDPRKWALPHELMHVLQRCVATPPIDEGQDWYHANWVRDGIRRVVDYMETWVDAPASVAPGTSLAQ